MSNPSNKSPNRTTHDEGFVCTDSDIEIKPLYTAEDLDAETERRVEAPGEYPFTRGIYPNMYRGRLWTMRQYSGYATAKETNERFRYLLKRGQTGVSVAFDLPTQMGYDSTHSLAEGEVGKAGVAIDSLQDIESLFERIPLEGVTTSMTINATAPILLAFYVALAKKQGADLGKIGGTVQNDILKEYIARATYVYPPGPSLRLVTDVFEYCSKNLPRWNTISISGYHIREAGSSAAQELAFTFANAMEYVRSAISRGLDVNRFGARLSFFFACHNNFFEEIAKFRTARRIWARTMKNEFGATNPKAMMLRFHTQTAGSTLTAQQPDNNLIRVAFQALAAVLGGTQSLHTNSKDEALALPTQEAAKIALRTQQVIAFESGVADTADPLAGSYFLEKLTTTLEEKVLDYLSKIKQIGGAIEAIDQKYFQSEIAKSAYDYQSRIESKDQIVIGVNEFLEDQVSPLSIHKVDPEVQKVQCQRIEALKKTRDNAAVAEGLGILKKAARSSVNLLPLMIRCAERYATLGEIADALREEFGVYRDR
jgi:methylmalonyl-CoA mutase N-terminal domain/subunit